MPKTQPTWNQTVVKLRAHDRLRLVIERAEDSHDLSIPTIPLIEHLVDEVLADELIEHGLREDSEPNAYGLEIEDAIEKVNRFRLEGNLPTIILP